MTHYETLSVTPEATSDDIKKAYRSLAQKHHPDKQGDKEVFQAIQAAYAILSDTKKRSAYDRGEPIEASLAEQIEAAAIAGLLKIFDHILERCDEHNIARLDLKKTILTEISNGEANLAVNKREAQRQLRKWKKAKRQLKAGEFIFAARIHEFRLKAIQDYKQNVFSRRIIDRMKVMADTIDFDFEPQIMMDRGTITWATGAVRGSFNPGNF